MRIALVPCFAVIVAFSYLGASFLSAHQTKPASEEQIARLVQQLGDPTHATREIAEQRLLEIGTPAKTKLQATLTSPGRVEVQARAARILVTIEHRNSQAKSRAIQERIDAFVRNAPDASPPSWKRYAQIAGDDGEARQFFIGMLRSEPVLLAGYDQGPDEAAAQFENYWLQRDANRIMALFPNAPPLENVFPGLQRKINQPRSLETLAALYLVAGDENVTLPEPLVQNLIGENAWYQAGDCLPLKKLIFHWFQKPVSEAESELFSRKIGTAAAYNAPDSTDWLIDVAFDPKQPIGRRLEALLAIQRLNTPSQRNRIETLLKDTTVLKDGTLLQDVALAVLVRLTNQAWKDYGFAENAPTFLSSQKFKKLRFKSPARREEALTHWQQWSQQERKWNELLAAFSADLDGSKKISLPGWPRFQQLVGTAPEARALFVEMQQAHRDLIATYDQEPAKVNAQLKELFQALNNSTLGTLGTFLFFALDQHADLCWPLKQQLHNTLNEPRLAGLKNADEAISPVLILLARLQNHDRKWNARLAAFAQDTRGIWKLSLPSWSRYRKQLGASLASRQFFVEMQQTEPKLLEAYQQSPEAAAEQFEACCQVLRDFPGSFSAPSMAAMLLVASDGRVKISESGATLLCERIAPWKWQVAQTALGSEVLHRLMFKWIELPTDSDPMLASKLNLALAYDLQETAPALIAAAANHKLKPETRIRALCGAAILGDRQQIPLVEPLLTDTSAYKHEQKQVELRDVALAVLVSLSSQPLQEYGFRVKADDLLVDHLDADRLLEKPEEQLQFDLADRRQAALDKWQAWSEHDKILRDNLEAFASGSQKVEVPGWHTFCEIVGDTPQSRKLFIEMQQASPWILEAYARTPAEGAKALEQEAKIKEPFRTRDQMRGRNRTPSVGMLAGQLFVAADKQIFPGLASINSQLLSNLIQNDLVYNSIQKNYPAAMRKLISRWIRRPKRGGGGGAGLGLWDVWAEAALISKYGLKEDGQALALRTLKQQAEVEDRGQTWLWAQLFYLNLFGKFGDQSCLEGIQLVEQLLEDRTLLTGGSTALYLRDFALAVLIRATGQKFEDYELTQIKIDAFQDFIDQESASFDSPEARERAHAKWKAWSKANLQQDTQSS